MHTHVWERCSRPAELVHCAQKMARSDVLSYTYLGFVDDARSDARAERAPHELLSKLPGLLKRIPHTDY
jgi:hypothetical protein